MSDKITLQRIFDLAWQKFIVEEAPPAVYKEGGNYFCSYLTEDGCKCAIGLALPDGHPAQQMQCEALDVVLQYSALFDQQILNLDYGISRIQRILHDSHVNTETGVWKNSVADRKQAYIALAKDYSLTIPESPLTNQEASV